MPPPPPFQPTTGSATHRLARALLSASKPSRSWSPAIEQLLRFRLLPAAAPLTLTPPLVAAIIDPYLLPYHTLASGLFHWAAQQPNFSHTPETYHSLLKSLSLSRHPHLIRPLLKTAKSHNVPLLSSSYHLAIFSLLKYGKSIEASELIDAATEELPTSLYNSLLAALSSDGLLDVARQVFGRMFKRNIFVNYVSFGVFIGKVCDLEGLDGVLGMLDGAKEMDFGFNGSVIASLIISRLCRAGKIEDACCALEQLRNRGFKPDFIPYRIVSEGYILAGRVEEAERILKKKRKYGVAPRANDYREFILSSISDKRIQEAKELGEAIVGGQFPIDNDVLNVLIGSVSFADPESAILFCNYMIGKDQFPSLSVLSKLSKNLCRNQKSDKMWNVFKVLMDKGFFSGLEQYNLMVSFLCKAGRVREAYNVLREMKKNGVCPDIYSYNSLMEACCRGDLLRPAKKLWDEMFANGCSANLHTYNILINKFSEEGKTEEARHLYCHLLDKGIVPDSATYITLITVLCREDRIEDAIQIYKKSMHQDKAIGSSVLRNLVFSLCKDGKYTAASGLIQSLPSEAECTDSHVILLKGLTEAGLVEMSVEHIGWVQTNVHSKFQAILTDLMASLSTAPSLEPVKQLLQAMHARGFVSANDPWILRSFPTVSTTKLEARCMF